MAVVFRIIWVEFIVEVLHRYVAAASDPALRDVAYLGSTHQHFARFKVSIGVSHADRELELHQFRRWVLGCFPVEPVDFGGRSIEAIADELHAKIAARFPGREVEIDVSEDGVVGATMRYPVQELAS